MSPTNNPEKEKKKKKKENPFQALLRCILLMGQNRSEIWEKAYLKIMMAFKMTAHVSFI
jgi:endonuclease III